MQVESKMTRRDFLKIVLGMGASFLPTSKSSFFFKHMLENDIRENKQAQKQAIIIFGVPHGESIIIPGFFWSALGGLGSYEAHKLLKWDIKKTTSFFLYFTLFSSALRGIFGPCPAHVLKLAQLEKALEKRGFSVHTSLTKDVIKKVSKNSNSHSKTFVYVVAHGDYEKEGYSYMKFEKELTPKKLFDELDKINGKKAVFIEACRSGGFVEYLKRHAKKEDYVLATSSEKTLSSGFHPFVDNLIDYINQPGEVNLADFSSFNKPIECKQGQPSSLVSFLFNKFIELSYPKEAEKLKKISEGETVPYNPTFLAFTEFKI